MTPARNLRPTGPPKTARRVVEPEPAAPAGPAAAWEVACRIAYCQERSRYESLAAAAPVEYRPPTLYDGTADTTTEDGLVLQRGRSSIWKRLGIVLKAEAADPFAYMAAQFDAKLAKYAPEPHMMAVPSAIQHWRAFREKAAGRARDELRLDAAAVSAAIAQHRAGGADRRTAAVRALVAVEVEASPLCRYCSAVAFGLDDPADVYRRVADTFRGRALAQYRRRRSAYREAWAGYLPPGLDADALAPYRPLFDVSEVMP